MAEPERKDIRINFGPAAPQVGERTIEGTIGTVGGDIRIRITGAVHLVRGFVIQTEYGDVTWPIPS